MIASRPALSRKSPTASSGRRRCGAAAGTWMRASTKDDDGERHVRREDPAPRDEVRYEPAERRAGDGRQPQVAATIPSAAPRRSRGTTSPMAAVATGKMPPAPSACSARAARKTGYLGATIANDAARGEERDATDVDVAPSVAVR